MTSLERALNTVVRVLDHLAVPYAVMGGLAVRVYAIPRFTNDVDISISLDRAKLTLLFESLQSVGCEIPAPFHSGWLDSVAGLPFFHVDFVDNGKTIEVDVFVAETEFQFSMMQRRRTFETPGGDICFVSPEDLILLKLLASRPRDLIDVQDIFFTMGELDIEYLKRWAIVLSISPALEKALEQQAEEY